MDFSYPLMDLKNTFLKLCARCTDFGPEIKEKKKTRGIVTALSKRLSALELFFLLLLLLLLRLLLLLLLVKVTL